MSDRGGVRMGLKPHKIYDFLDLPMEAIPIAYNTAARRTIQYFLAATFRRFERQIDPNGARWKPISERTKLLRRQGEGKPHQKELDHLILIDTGRLRNSVTGQNSPGNITKVKFNAKKLSIEIGTNVHYARKHQYGIGVPQRSFLGFSMDDADHISEIFRRSFETAMESIRAQAAAK